MAKATIVGFDQERNVFQVHGAAADGTIAVPQKADAAAAALRRRDAIEPEIGRMID